MRLQDSVMPYLLPGICSITLKSLISSMPQTFAKDIYRCLNTYNRYRKISLQKEYLESYTQQRGYTNCAIYGYKKDPENKYHWLIDEFIEIIIVHAPERIDGDRVQEVEIHFRFIGQFELPAPELTEEEIKWQEQLKRHRIKSRERYQKIKAGEHAVGQPFTLTRRFFCKNLSIRRTQVQRHSARISPPCRLV